MPSGGRPAGQRPYLWIDATYAQAREQGRMVSTAVIIATGVNTDGRREVPGMAAGPSEAEPFRAGFLRSPIDRGLRGVKLVVAATATTACGRPRALGCLMAPAASAGGPAA